MVADIKDRTPNQATVDQLRRLLEEAEKGELRSLFVVHAYDDDRVTHSWCMDSRNSPRRMLAEMVMAQHDWVVNIEMKEGDSVLFRAIC